MDRKRAVAVKWAIPLLVVVVGLELASGRSAGALVIELLVLAVGCALVGLVLRRRRRTGR